MSDAITIRCSENTLSIPCDTNRVSDGYHTFAELYDHRAVLFITLMRQRPELSWRSWLHDDGSSLEHWFIAGMGLPAGMVTYHIPSKLWPYLDDAGIHTFERAPKWDGHNSQDVLARLLKWREVGKAGPVGGPSA
jgi:hypothetical protein